jgi:ketosteroid isomerase-like protein
MIGKIEAQKIAKEWCEAWNSKDIDAIMEHYADDVIFYSPTVIARWGHPDGKLTGKTDLRKNFSKGLELNPDLHFELMEVLTGTDGMTVFYRRETGALVADVVLLDSENRGKIVKAYYS